MKKTALLLLILSVISLAACNSADGEPVNFPSADIVVNADLPDFDTETAPETAPKSETEAPLTEPREPEKITFLAAGDNVIHPCIYIDAKNRATSETRAYNFKPMYSDVADFIASFDLAFINQETLMCGEGYPLSGYPNFNSPQDLGRDLRDIGFDIINIANNHTLDKGSSGYAATLDFYNSEEMSDITMIGGYKSSEDYDNIRTVKKGDITIAFLSYAQHTNGHALPASSELVMPYINDADIIRQAAIAEEIADITVCSVHWGEENTYTPDAEQRRVARLLSENGVDVILGHHPHVLQKIEIIETEKGNTLCIYSLGNLLSAMQYWQNMVGGFFTFDIVKYEDGKTVFDNPRFTPTAFFYGPSYYNSHLYFLKDYREDTAKSHGTGRLYGSPATPAQMLSFAEGIMGDYLDFDGFSY